MKSFIKLIIIMIAVVSLSVSTLALTEGDWEFKLLDDEITITGYIGDGGKVVVPDRLMDRPVTRIATEDSLNNRMFPDSVTSITFPSTVKCIGGLFANYEFVSMLGSNSTLQEVIIPEGVEKIDARAFQNCTALESVVLPSTITEIGDFAFACCTKMKLDFLGKPDLIKIGCQAFIDCKSLTSFEFPLTLKEIRWEAFAGSGLEAVDLPPIKSVENKVFYLCTDLKRVAIGNGYVRLDYSMFKDCTALEEVYLPSSLKTISPGMFENCVSLKQIILPVSLETIEESAFKGCSGLKELAVPYGCKTINGDFGFLESGAFSDCINLQAVYLPDSLTFIGKKAFNNTGNCIVFCGAGSKAAEFCKINSISYMTDRSVNSEITVLYNGSRISFHAYDQNPELINSRALVPLRSIFEAMGAEVEWIDETQTVIATRNNIKITLQIGSNIVKVNEKSISIDTVPILLNKRTMVPVRVVAEGFGADVKWHDAGKTVIITEA